MRNYLLKKWIELRYCDEGVTLVEYGVAVALAVGVGIGALNLLAGDITAAMGAAGAQMP